MDGRSVLDITGCYINSPKLKFMEDIFLPTFSYFYSTTIFRYTRTQT